MPVRIEIPVGTRFGRLEIIGEAPDHRQPSGQFYRIMKCLCDCGKITEVYLTNLRNRNTQSCGCVRDKATKARMTTHGKTKTRTYKSWRHMRERCERPKEKRYADYGGRGITVCERWSRFENFLEDMGEVPLGMSIERIDNNGNYEPSNCKWADRVEQGSNKRNNVLIELNGEVLTVAHWSRKTGIGVCTIRARLAAGYPPNEILDPNFGKVLYNGSYSTIDCLCKLYGVAKTTFFNRRRHGLSVEQALTIRHRKRHNSVL